jgi:hypothetical protein
MSDFNSIAQPWSMAAPTQNKLPVNPDHPFYYKHWPANWEFGYSEYKKGKKTELKPVFYPSITMERVVPGVNGVSQLQGEIGDPGSRLGRLQQKGYTILDPNNFDYLRVYPAKYGGKRHSSKWETFRVLAGQVVTEFNTKEFNKWRVGLIVDGYIQLPDSHFLELIILSQKRISERLIASQHLPEIRKKLDAEYKRISDMELAMKDIKECGHKYYEDLVNVD